MKKMRFVPDNFCPRNVSKCWWLSLPPELIDLPAMKQRRRERLVGGCGWQGNCSLESRRVGLSVTWFIALSGEEEELPERCSCP